MERFTGVKDSDKEILKSIESDRDLISTCLINKYFSSLCDETFFHNRLIQKYPSLQQYKNKGGYKKFYLKIVYYIDKLKSEFNFEYDSGNPEKIYDFILEFERDLEINEEFSANLDVILSNAMYNGSQLNSISLVNYIIDKEQSDLNSGLMGAAISGNFNVVQYLISKGADEWGLGLAGAARGNNSKMFDFFLSKATDEDIQNYLDDIWEAGVESGNLYVVKFVLDRKYIPHIVQLRHFLRDSSIPDISKDYLKSRFNL